MCGPICNCYLNGFDSKETSIFYYVFSEPYQSQGIIITVWNSHYSVTNKVGDSIVQVKIIMLFERMDGIFDLHINFVRVQFEAKVLVTCTNLVQCCAVEFS